MVKFDITQVYLYKVFKEPIYNLLVFNPYEKSESILKYLSLKDYIKYLKDKLKNNKTRNLLICFMYNKQKKSKVITINLD